MFTVSTLAATTVILAVTSIVSLLNARQAVSIFDEKVLPNVAKSLELAERVSHLAATAPYVAEVAITSKLTQESAALKARQRDVEALMRELPLRDSASSLAGLLTQLQASVDELINVKRQDLFLREDMRSKLFVLEQLRRAEDAGSKGSAADAAVRFVLTARALQLAAVAANVDDLAALEAEFGQHAALLHGGAQADAVAALREVAASIFALRRDQLRLEGRKAYLLARTRVLSDQVTVSVNARVRGVQADVTARKEALRVVVGTGATGVLIVSGMAAVMLLTAVLLVRRSLGRLEQVTNAMTSLAASGVQREPIDVVERDEIGRLVEAFKVFRDNALSMQRMASSISEQTRLLETVFNCINDGLSVFDRQSRLVAWNPRYVELLGLDAQHTHRGMTLMEIQALLPGVSVQPPTGAAGQPLSMLNEVRAQEAHSFEVTLANGRILSFRSQPMPDGGFVTLYSDLTERRAMDLQFRQSQKMEVLGQLTGGVAHDFNNLLAAIMSNLQLLESDASLSPQTCKVVERALRASERGAALTRRMLAFARRQPLYPQAVKVDDMIRELRDLIEHSVGQAIVVEMDLASDGVQVCIDQGQLENALLNLALNAGAAMPRGGHLRFATRRTAPAAGSVQGWVEIRVADTGAGMADDVLQRVFEPFFTTKRSEGSGLGLSIVYGFVKQSGGDIDVASHVGRGTEFVLRLPVMSAAAQVDIPQAQPVMDLPAGLQLLLVEDDADVRPALMDLLRQLGAVVTVATSMAEAVSLMQRLDFDVVLSDVGLGPQGDGLTLQAWVRSHRPGVPVLLVSGLPSDLLAQRYAVTSDTRILRKPFTATELREALAETLTA